MANETKQATHTPAPWHAPEPDVDGWMWPAVYDQKNLLVADCHNSLHSITDEEKANARLIAAAPDLYAELAEQVLSWISENDHYSADHLLYECNECGAAVEDDYLLIRHDDDCTVGRSTKVLLKATGATA